MSLEALSTALDKTYAVLGAEHRPQEVVWQADTVTGYHPLPALPDGTEVTVVHWRQHGAGKRWAVTRGPITYSAFGAAYVGHLCVAIDGVPTVGVHRVSWRADQ